MAHACAGGGIFWARVDWLEGVCLESVYLYHFHKRLTFLAVGGIIRYIKGGKK